MAANTSPIFVLTPNVGLAQNVNVTSITTNPASGTPVLLFTAGANGAYMDEVHMKALGTNVASLMRFFYNNSGAVGTPGNNAFWRDFPLPATTASNTTSQPYASFKIGKALGAGCRIYCAVSSAAGAGISIGSGFDVVLFGGDY